MEAERDELCAVAARNLAPVKAETAQAARKQSRHQRMDSLTLARTEANDILERCRKAAAASISVDQLASPFNMGGRSVRISEARAIQAFQGLGVRGRQSHCPASRRPANLYRPQATFAGLSACQVDC